MNLNKISTQEVKIVRNVDPKLLIYEEVAYVVKVN